MILSESQGTLILDFDNPMTLPTLIALRRSLIDEGGFRDMVRRLDPVIDAMRDRIDEYVHVLDLKQEDAKLASVEL